ncbi:4-hydroxy-2-oxo-heptane-1,7-dioate aldolase [Methyloligella halotolerans]|uniref:4-hydroxy-2-oxo-heptane-1,7-dioate aldolase n=1 Tax=Methyloligella halotolerans TaxID=1177755 RepID=A0A1E2S2Y3_9HYPH|nr:aldolase/citrate lyase family protein [Methyloligella halotolerans]ODA68876.1 4-hydroxy-2-oxo-heptane-1,7-dioate aldolase [Methyloligella halotolerans]
MSEDRFREAAKAGRPLYNAWLTLGSPFAIELIAKAGWDCVTIDQQHGIGGHSELVACLTAARAARLPAMVRIAENDKALIGRALDAGAQGVVCPLIESADDAARFIRAVKYPPRGIRSWGPYRARLEFEGDYFSAANGWTIACAQIETAGAMDSLDEILALDGLDMVCLGPNDLSVALTGELNIRAPEVIEAMAHVLRKAKERGVIALIFANDIDFARPAVEAGWDVVAIGTDASWLASTAAEIRRSIDRKP